MSKVINKRKRSGDLNQQIEEAELNVFKVLGESLKKRQEHENQTDEDHLFGELIVAHLKQLLPSDKIRIKMEINNLIYRQLMSYSAPSQSHSQGYLATTSTGTMIASSNEYQHQLSNEMQHEMQTFPPGYFFNRYNKQN